jgi:hypothetical protein
LRSVPVTFTSSLATFGGTSRNDQTLAHFTNNGFSANSAEVLAFIELIVARGQHAMVKRK